MDVTTAFNWWHPEVLVRWGAVGGMRQVGVGGGADWQEDRPDDWGQAAWEEGVVEREKSSDQLSVWLRGRAVTRP